MKLKMKSILSSLLSLSLIMGSFTAMKPLTAHAEETSSTTKITILGTSDIHGIFMPWDYSMDAQNLGGSLTQIYTAVKEVRASNPNTILVDVGDAIQGNSVELLTENENHPMMVAMNKMGYDTWTMGNHEFDFGFAKLNKVLAQFKGQALAGNVYKKADNSRYLPAYKIIEKDGVKVAVVGITTPMVVTFAQGTDRFNDYDVKDAVPEIRNILDELKGKVDAIVGTIHMGEDNENAVANTGVRDLANAFPEFTAIIAGHMHKAVKSSIVNGVLITEPDKYGAAVSKVDLTFKKAEGKVELVDKKSDLINIKNAYASDKELEQLLNPYHELLRADANTKIGELKGIDMVPQNEIKGIPSVQVQSTPLTRFFNEVQLYYSKADVAAISIDNDKAMLNVGPITKKDIAYNYQYAGGETTVYEVTGKDLKDYMEWSADYFNTLKPGDVTVSFNPIRRASKYSTDDIFSGVTYKIDLTEQKGYRIKDLVLISSGKQIKETDVIKLGMNSYRMDQLLAKGGALEGRKFKILWSSKESFGEEAGTIRNRAIDYIKNVKNGVIETKDEKNWQVVGLDTTSKEHKAVKFLLNKGIIEVPKSADGKYINVASININDTVTQEEINAVVNNANVSGEGFKAGMKKGELYTAVYYALNPSEVLPKTGSMVDTGLLFLIGTLIAVCGIFVVFTSRTRKSRI